MELISTKIGSPVLTAEEMKSVEKKVGLEMGITELQMITLAASSVFTEIENFYQKNEYEKNNVCLFFCGKGHNGADGLKTAEFALKAGYNVEVFHITSGKGYSGETKEILKNLEDLFCSPKKIGSTSDINNFEKPVLVVDGILGMGVSRPAEGLVLDCIRFINGLGVPTLSIDVPSGVYSDTNSDSVSIRADQTISLGCRKLSQFYQPSSEKYGTTIYKPICFPQKNLNSESSISAFTFTEARYFLPKRNHSAHKYSTGRVLVIAGSKGMHGAAVLASKAAMKSGAGLVKLAVPKGIYDDVLHHLLEVISLGVGKSQDMNFLPEHISELNSHLDWADVILLGPGLGKNSSQFLDSLIPKIDKKLILDGDGLNFFENYLNLKKSIHHSDKFILTPHHGEYKRISGVTVSTDAFECISDLKNFTRDSELNILLKGSTTIFGKQNGHCIIQSPGPNNLATAGTGDILAGIIAALACHLDVSAAACLGAFIHKSAGKLALEKKGILGTIAGDVLEEIPSAIIEIES